MLHLKYIISLPPRNGASGQINSHLLDRGENWASKLLHDSPRSHTSVESDFQWRTFLSPHLSTQCFTHQFPPVGFLFPRPRRTRPFSDQMYQHHKPFKPQVGNWSQPYPEVGTLVAQTGKNLPAVQRPGFHSWVGMIPWRRAWQPTPVFLPGKFHGQRSLAGYSLWGHQESDMTEWLTLSLSLLYIGVCIGTLRDYFYRLSSLKVWSCRNSWVTLFVVMLRCSPPLAPGQYKLGSFIFFIKGQLDL